MLRTLTIPQGRPPAIESANEQLLPTLLVKTMIAALSVMLSKIKNAAGYDTVMQALTEYNDSETMQTTAMAT
jgi:NAD/NADP transhydrogenase alpha subunit